jgi:hypothetical protein
VASQARRAAAAVVAIAAASLGVAACAGSSVAPSGDGGVRTDVGTVVVGLTTGLRAGTDFDRLHVVETAGGKVLRDDTLPTASAPLAFPMELAFSDRPAGEVVEVDLTATSTKVPTLSLARRAATRVVGGKDLLFRVSLDAPCLSVDAPGGTRPPECGASETCAAGACVPAAVDPSALEPYDPSWSKGGAPDRCRPLGGGPPEVVVGQGQADYLPVDDCSAASPTPAQIEAGPQGGHHVWVAARMKNLHQSGSITTVRGHFPDLAKDPWDMAVIFTYEPDEGGYCKLYGIRYQLDTNGVALSDVFGKRLELTVEVKDADGTTGIGKRCVLLSKDSK